MHRVLKWSGPIAIGWIWVFEELHQRLLHSWQFRVHEGSAARSTLFGVLVIYFLVLALAALMVHLLFFFKRPAENSLFSTARSLLPHFLLSGILFGTSIVLDSPGVDSSLELYKLGFLGNFLFYVAAAWSQMALLVSLMPGATGSRGIVPR